VDLLIGLNGRELSAFRLAAAAREESPAESEERSGRRLFEQFLRCRPPLFWNLDQTGHRALPRRYPSATVPRAVDQAANDIVGACPVGAMAALTSDRRPACLRVPLLDRFDSGQGRRQSWAHFTVLEVPYVFGVLHDPAWQMAAIYSRRCGALQPDSGLLDELRKNPAIRMLKVCPTGRAMGAMPKKGISRDHEGWKNHPRDANFPPVFKQSFR